MDAFSPPEGDPGTLRASASKLRGIAGHLSGQQGIIRTQAGVAADTWQGGHALTLRAGADGVVAQAGDAGSSMAGLADVLTTLAADLQTVIDDVEQNRVMAEHARAEVRTKSIGLDPRDPVDEAKRAQADLAGETAYHHYAELALEAKTRYLRRARAAAARIDALTDRAVPGGAGMTPLQITGAVDTSTGVDGLRGATTLTEAQAWAALSEWTHPHASGSFLDGLALSLVAAMPPADAAHWWQGLTPLQQMQAINADPSLGNLDGVSGWARDLANRSRLSAVRADLEAQLEQIRDQRDGAGGYNPYTGNSVRTVLPSPEAARLVQKLRALDAMETTLSRGGRQLLLLDADSGHQMHSAIAIGDVDTADNVSVFTPGLNSSVQHSLLGYDDDLSLLQKRAAQEAARHQLTGSSTAMVTWQGYDAPQLDEALSGNRSVASSHLAQEGGERLASFFQGIDRSRPGGVDLIALGHSYGSVTTAYALHHAHTGVDYAGVFGSPGLAVRDVRHLDAPAGHLYALEADRDLVADFGSFGPDPSYLPGITMLSTDADAIRHTQANTGHTHYLDDGTTSQLNLATLSLGHREFGVRSDQQPPDYPYQMPAVGATDNW